MKRITKLYITCLFVIAVIILLIYMNATYAEPFESGSDIERFVDIVYYINLDHRKDRKEEILKELENNAISNTKIQRIEAVYNKEKGALGCTASHIKTLKEFIKSGKSTCLILEDDFVFNQTANIVNKMITGITDYDYDVIMLSGNVLKSEPSENQYLSKVIDAQTTSGYIVKRHFAQTLLKNFEEGYELFKLNKDQPELYAIDMYWKRLQPHSKWYITNPVIGAQRQSYSDIEERLVDYGV